MIGTMSPQQLVLRDRSDGGMDLEAVDNPANMRPINFEEPDKGVHIPHLGSQDLLRLASALSSEGYRVQDIDLRDSFFQEVDEDEEVEALENEAIGLLRQGKDAEASSLFRKSQKRLFIVGVELREPKGPRRVKIARDGVLFIRSVSSVRTDLSQLIRVT